MGSRELQNKRYSKDLSTCSVLIVSKKKLTAVLQRLYRCKNSRIQDCIDAKIKEKIDDAKIANLREPFRKP